MHCSSRYGERSIETSATLDAMRQLWVDVESWGAWNAEIETIEVSGLGDWRTVELDELLARPVRGLI